MRRLPHIVAESLSPGWFPCVIMRSLVASTNAELAAITSEVDGRIVDGPTKTAQSTRTVFMAGYPAQRMIALASYGPLVPDAKGNRMSPNKVSREYGKMMRAKGARYVPMRNLRNSYATIMQGLGASDSLISKSLGHTNLQIDYAHYFAANAPAHMANARMLGDALLHRVTS